MKLLSIVLFSLPVFAQLQSLPVSNGNTLFISMGVRAGCTPDSMAVARAGSLAAQELGRWTCYAQNLTTTPQKLSQVGFALDFMELHQLGAADVADVFSQKQKMSKAGKAARTAEVVGVVAAMATGLSGITVSARVIGAIGTVTYGAGKLGDYANRQIPPSTNALAGQWGPADTVVLAPGQAIQWKVYASKMKGAKEVGPKILTVVP